MSIQQLPEDVIAQIKSSTTIASINGVICGLVKNSLDAGATKVTISVDYSRGNCSAEDNGSGILPAEFRLSGGLGNLHYTSKFPARSEFHGRSGEFLASLAALSLLSVTSHHYGYHSHNSIKFHNSVVLARQTPCPPDQRLMGFSHGTRATVRDLFGSMPVRVKQRAALVDKVSTSRDWEQLKHAIAALVLAWPCQVSISLRNSVNRQSAVIRGGNELGQSHPEKARGSDLISRVSKLLHEADLSDGSLAESWVHLKASAGQLNISGAVSLTPVATKRIQFISIGIQPVSNERGPNVLYDEINRIFANSAFGVQEERSDVDEAEKFRRAQDRRYKTDGYTANDLKGKKGVDRWPMFYIRICTAETSMQLHDVEEILDERRQSLKTIMDVLKVTIFEFLKRHHFRPTHPRAAKDESPKHMNSPDKVPKLLSRSSTPITSQTSSGKSSRRFMSDTKSTMGDLATTNLRLAHAANTRPQSESPFDVWTRIKSGRPSLTMAKDVESLLSEPVSQTDGHVAEASSSNAESISPSPLLDSAGNLVRVPFIEVDDSLALKRESSAVSDVGQGSENTPPMDSEGLIWENPDTKHRSIIDPRTGFIVNLSDALSSSSKQSIRVSRLASGNKARLQESASKGETGTWVEELISSWENPVFKPAESPIPVAIDKTMLLSSVASGPGKCGLEIHLPSRHGASEAFQDLGVKVSKDALRYAEIIAQVDRKFIFARLPLKPGARSTIFHASDPSLLVIIDQHAADERGRVEELMGSYFEPYETNNSSGGKARTISLQKPLQYEISTQERPLFERYLTYLEKWGIVYQVHGASISATESRGSSQLKVLRLPLSIAERCRMEPRILIDLLRKEVWRLDDHGRGNTAQYPRTSSADQSNRGPELHWLSRFYGCPQGILDMINSRACRSAIMFNDELSNEDCKNLLTRLANCAFPFQCAHGRPSMVPLVDLGDARINQNEGSDLGGGVFGAAFKRWKSGTHKRGGP